MSKKEQSSQVVAIHDPLKTNALGGPSFAAGNTAGRGRPRGSANKTTRLLKDAIIEAAVLFGDQHKNEHGVTGLTSYMYHLAVNQPKSFASLVARVLPLQSNVAIESPPIVMRSREEIIEELRKRGIYVSPDIKFIR